VTSQQLGLPGLGLKPFFCALYPVYVENGEVIIDHETEQDFADTVIDIVGAVAARQMEEKVREILDEMPERDRRLIRAVFIEERDKDEVCREFGVDRDYLRVLLHRAKQTFKSHYLKNIERRPPGVSVGKR